MGRRTEAAPQEEPSLSARQLGSGCLGDWSVVAEEKIRVLVVDDDPNFVDAARAMLAADQRLEVVGGASNGEEAVAKVAALHPQVVAMDVVMPGRNRPRCRRHTWRGVPGGRLG